MDRYKAYLLPGAAAVLVLSYYAWRWASGVDVTEPARAPASPKAAADSKADAGGEPTPRAPDPVAPGEAPRRGEPPKE